MIIHFRRAKRALHIERQQDLLAQTVMELFPDRPVTDIELAVGAGSKAIERGTPFFDAMEIAEGIIEAKPRAVDTLSDQTQCNQRRMT